MHSLRKEWCFRNSLVVWAECFDRSVCNDLIKWTEIRMSGPNAMNVHNRMPFYCSIICSLVNIDVDCDTKIPRLRYILPKGFYDTACLAILGVKGDKASRDMLGFYYQLTSVVRAQSRWYWQCKCLLFYTIDMAPIRVNKKNIELFCTNFLLICENWLIC